MRLRLAVALAGAVGSLASVSGFSQGQLIFVNNVDLSVVAPVYGVDLADPSVSKQGNTGSGIPVGTQTYGGTLLAGTGFTAQLFAGPQNTAPENLAALQPSAPFRTGNGAGFVVAPDFAVTVSGVGVGARAVVQLRAWDNRGGMVTNWEQVVADPTIAHGQSRPFLSLPLGGLFTPPPNLVGLESFNLWQSLGVPFSLSIALVDNGVPQLLTTGPSGRLCRIEYRSSLSNSAVLSVPPPWTEMTNFVLTATPCVVQDVPATAPARFYRAVLLP